MSSLGKVLENRFELIRQIGQGGMSRVYIAKDLKINKEWAVKEIARSNSNYQINNSLMTEANLMKGLDHRYLPRIVDIIQEEEKIYIVMDYVEGESLDVVLKEKGTQSVENITNWMGQALEALEYLHSQNPPIIYRDMKPGNLMLKPDGSIVIIDFGIAREFKYNEEDTTILGTKGYAPPEQYQGKSDIRSDIYALGVTMYRLLTGKTILESKDAERKYKSIKEENLYSVLEKCTKPDPNQRYQTCKEVLTALKNPEENLNKTKKVIRRKKTRYLISLSLAITCVIAGISFYVLSVREKDISYMKLVDAPETVSLDEKKYRLVEAAKLEPTKTQSYIKLIEVFYEESFGKEEATLLASVLENYGNKIKSHIDKKNIWYNAGLLFFHRYGIKEDVSFGDRVRRAYGYFERALSIECDDWEYSSIANCYFQICKFYKTYVLSSSEAKEATTLEYMELLHSVKETMETATNLEALDRLTLANAGFMLIFDLRQAFYEKEIGLAVVMDTIEFIENEVKQISVSRNEAVKLKKEILENVESYKGIIERTYKE